MPNTINLFDSYHLAAVAEDVVPKKTFFKDRYFPTSEEDLFDADEVLTEYQNGDRQMAAFVSPHAGDIPMDRDGYEVRSLKPAFIAPSRLLKQDDLTKRGFGEALYPNTPPAVRATKLQRKDMEDMDLRIARREEWMAVQTMINNACTIQEYIDADTKGAARHVKFFDGSHSDHTYAVANMWNKDGGDMFGDVRAMCRMLSDRGLDAVDLLLGSEVADEVLNMEKVQNLLNKNSGIIIGQIEQELSPYSGIVYMGTINFGGFKLNLISVDSTYEDEKHQTQKYFPATSAMVTAPNCGHMMYGRIMQINHGETEFTNYIAKRVPKLIIDQENDIRKLRLAARPLAAPHNYCPYIYAANVIG